MIPHQLIEKAARILAGTDLEHLHPEDSEIARNTARQVINAVAPDIWDEAAAAIWAESGEGWNGEYPGDQGPHTPNPYRTEETA